MGMADLGRHQLALLGLTRTGVLPVCRALLLQPTQPGPALLALPVAELCRRDAPPRRTVRQAHPQLRRATLPKIGGGRARLHRLDTLRASTAREKHAANIAIMISTTTSTTHHHH